MGNKLDYNKAHTILESWRNDNNLKTSLLLHVHPSFICLLLWHSYEDKKGNLEEYKNKNRCIVNSGMALLATKKMWQKESEPCSAKRCHVPTFFSVMLVKLFLLKGHVLVYGYRIIFIDSASHKVFWLQWGIMKFSSSQVKNLLSSWMFEKNVRNGWR